MNRYLIALACCLFTTPIFSYDDEAQEEFFPSTPEQIASLSNEPNYLIGGLISPLSGQPTIRETDLIAKGAQNIVLSRVYISPYIPCSFGKHKHNKEEYDKDALYHHLVRHYKGWQFYPHLKLKFTPNTGGVLLTEPSGMSIDFRLSGPNYSITSTSSSIALSNTAGDTPSGKYDPRNTRISYEDNGKKITVYSTDGTTRFYHRKGWITETEQLYLLEKESLPNGKVLKYHYSNIGQPSYIESLDPKERFVYASIRIQGSPWENNCYFTSSSGLTASYGYQKRPLHVKIKEKEKHWYGDEKYKSKRSYLCPPILTSVSSPFYRYETLDYCGRFLLSSYSGKDEIFTTVHTGFGEGSQHYRVHKLQLPVGPNDSFQPIYEFSYHPSIAGQREGVTTVKSSNGTSTVYHFSKNLLTTLIQYYGQDGGLKKEKVLSWDDKNWLKSLEMRDNQKNILYRKLFEYDHFGNPILEIFKGDLTGERSHNTFTTKRIFSEEGRSLLLREETEDGKVICFSYLPNTDLVTSKLIKERDQVILREFWVYDDCNNLIQTISDDGISEDRNNLSHVTQRTLKTYTLRESAPFLHMPKWIEETYWESRTEKSLKKSHLVYDQHGNIAQEEVYNAEGKHAYTISKTYNERGDVLSETNRLGQKATYTHDSKGRLETALNFSQRLYTTLRYDTKGRLKAEIEKGDDGIIHETYSEYDFHDHKTQETNSYKNITRYTYDPLIHEIVKTDLPPIASIDGQTTSVSIVSNYDPFGRQQAKTDANGNTTTYRYNAYGSPTEIIHPNGGKELFLYAKNGLLNSYTDLDGLVTYFKRDILGRVLSKTYISSDGKTVATEVFTYNGFNLLTEVDKEGNLKEYSYDGAGRKIQEKFCGHVTDFAYDALGWLATICKHNRNNTLLIHYKRDLEGRILEETKTDVSNHILYKISHSYDEDGNRKDIVRYINGKEAPQTFNYDSISRLIAYQDAEGFVSKTTYNENFTNSLGQKVLQKTTIDPRRITTLKTYDALMRPANVEVLNAQGPPVSHHDLIHDPQGNLLYRRDRVYENGNFQNTQTIKYTYTQANHIASLTRAFGTQDARTTVFTYLYSGNIATKTLPDGVTLTYSYHPLGFMSRLDSSDDKIHHAFDYNLLGYLKSAIDEKQGIAISRQVDPCGNVLQEVFPHDLEITKDYDDFNRLTLLKIRGQGEIHYAYDSLFLRKIIRTSSLGEALYTHTYEDYDADGNLITENLIGHLGRISHEMNPRGYNTSISSPYFSQQCRYDSVGNLVSNITDGVEDLYSYDELSQLSSENSGAQSSTYNYNSIYNRTQHNGKPQEISVLNELLSAENSYCSYDLNGNQISKNTPSGFSRFIYDPLNRLVEVVSDKQKLHFIYDPLGRRLSKTTYIQTGYDWKEANHENYLYHDQHEIGAFSPDNESKSFRVLGLNKHTNNPATVSIELEGQCFASILDVQSNIRRLINVNMRAIEGRYDYTAFGEEVPTSLQTSGLSHKFLTLGPRQSPGIEIVGEGGSIEAIHPPSPTTQSRELSRGSKCQEFTGKTTSLFNPWRFSSKRLDPELGLIYFGKRYYDPLLGRWLSIDPAGFVDSVNLYQYLFNNPFYYFDPDGQEAVAVAISLWGASQAGGLSLAALAGPVGWVIGGAAILTTVLAWKGPAIVHKVNDWMTYKADTPTVDNEISEDDIDIYVPDRPLPRDPRTKEPIPEADAPHTELGTKLGRKGKYPQAREFDAQGRPVKDIDFTDHGRPQDHPYPHEHKWKPNPTGGTPQRSTEAEPLTR